ncbi:MAG: hypothetical protein R8J94_17995 [Acidimicrobiia bacterium]|nr:hypothetical protein [Acidimicrobiia bacterium]
MDKWKWLGIAGLLGVAGVAGGAAVARRRRSWTEVDSDELRERLHARLAERAIAPRDS